MKKKVTDFEVMDAMASENMDIAFYPDILEMKRDRKGAKVTVGVTSEAMDKLSRSSIGGEPYVGLLLVLNHSQFKNMMDRLQSQKA